MSTDASAPQANAADSEQLHDATRFPNKARRFGRLIISTCRQSGGHPWIDDAATTDVEGNDYRARAIRPSLRRRKAERRGGRALVIGWRK